ncbi:MAG: phage tail spike protein [Terrisporobacter sp.]
MENKKIIKACIFDHKASPSVVTTTNGDAILDNIIIEAKTDENLFTGEYYLDLMGLVDIEGLHKHIAEEAIVKVHMDYGDEYFRIAKIDKSTRDIRAFARQITISETLDMWLEDTRPTDASGQGALAILRDNSIGKKDIRVFSDITNTSTAYYQKMSMYKALHDCDQSFINRWGGEIQRRGYNLTINKKIGMDRGVQIRSRKNLTGFESKTDIDNVCTRISAKGYDGIQAKNFIDSPLINKYSAIKTKSFKYDFVKLKNENNPDEGYNTLEEAQTELERLARLEFTENHIDELRANYKINFVQLEYTEEYKNYVQAERVYIGDTIEVFEEKYNINIHVRAMRKKFDVLRQRVIEIELSNIDIKDKTLTNSDILSELQNIIKKTDSNSVQDIIQSMINSGIKDSYVIHRQNEIIVADNKNLNLAHNVARLNKNGLAFSQTGYYGKYSYGFTINGVINASLIATGILKAILIQNIDGSLQIDLSGSNGALFRNNGKDAIRIHNNSIDLFNHAKNGDFIGALQALVRIESDGTSNPDKPLVGLINDLDSALSIGYKTENKVETKSYVEFDKYNILKDEVGKAIRIIEEIDFKDNKIYRAILSSLNKKNYVYINDDQVSISFDEGKHFIKLTKEEVSVSFADEKYFINFTENGVSLGQTNSNIIIKDGKTQINGPVEFTGTVTGLPNTGVGGGGDDDGWENGILSAKGFRFIKGFEGFAPSRYQDSGGYWTIAYGVTLHGEPSIYNQLVSESPISEERGAKVSYDLKNKNYGARIIESVKRLGCTTQYQFDALCSLAYNCGTGVVTRSNRLTNAIAKDPTNESYIRKIWEDFYVTSSGNYLPGLAARRREECNMFFNRPFEVRTISKIPYSLGVVKENNGNGWLPEDNNNSNVHGHKSFDNAFGKRWLCPVRGIVTSVYGGRDNPTGSGQQFHKGTDIGAPMGTDYLASKDGTVTSQGWSNSMGNYIYIDHPGGYRTRVMHLSKILTRQGQTVKRGDLIGKVGSTGDSTGPHCHWEIRRLSDNQSTDPAPTLNIGDRV